MEAIEIIKDLVIQESGIDITEKCSKRKVIEVRSLFYHLCKLIKPLSTFQAIGEVVGRDHTTVMYSLGMYDVYSEYNKELNKLKHVIMERYRLEHKFFSIRTIDEEIEQLEKMLNELKLSRERLIEQKKNFDENLVM